MLRNDVVLDRLAMAMICGCAAVVSQVTLTFRLGQVVSCILQAALMTNNWVTAPQPTPPLGGVPCGRGSAAAALSDAIRPLHARASSQPCTSLPTLSERRAHLPHESPPLAFHFRPAQTIVDRCNESASSATSELMIEHAVSHMPKSPVIVALDSLTRFASFRPSPEVKARPCPNL